MSAARTVTPAQGTHKKTYQQVNINSVFAPSRAAGGAQQRSSGGATFGSIVAGGKNGPSSGGLQSLGKSTTIVKRRMPPPVSLPSMRAEGVDIDTAILVSDTPASPTWQTNNLSTSSASTAATTVDTEKAPASSLVRAQLRPPWQQGSTSQPAPAFNREQRQAKTISADFPTLGDVSTTGQLRPAKTGTWARGAEATPPIVEEPTANMMSRADAQLLPSWQQPMVRQFDGPPPPPVSDTRGNGVDDEHDSLPMRRSHDYHRSDDARAPQPLSAYRHGEEGVWSDDEAKHAARYAAPPPLINGLPNTSVPPPNYYPQPPPRFNGVRVGPITTQIRDVRIEESDNEEDYANERDRRDNSDRDAAIARARGAVPKDARPRAPDTNWRSGQRPAGNNVRPQRSTTDRHSHSSGQQDVDARPPSTRSNASSEEARAMPGTIRVMQRERQSPPTAYIAEDTPEMTSTKPLGKPKTNVRRGAQRDEPSRPRANRIVKAAHDIDDGGKSNNRSASNDVDETPQPPAVNVWAQRAAEQKAASVEPPVAKPPSQNRQDVRGIHQTQHNDNARKRHMETDVRRLQQQQPYNGRYDEEDSSRSNSARRGARGGTREHTTRTAYSAPRGTFIRNPRTTHDEVNGDDTESKPRRNDRGTGKRGARSDRPYANGDDREQRRRDVHDDTSGQYVSQSSRSTRGGRGGARVNTTRGGRAVRGNGVSEETTESRRGQRASGGQRGGRMNNRDDVVDKEMLLPPPGRQSAKSPPNSDGFEEWETASESSDVAQRRERPKPPIPSVVADTVEEVERPLSRNARGGRGGARGGRTPRNNTERYSSKPSPRRMDGYDEEDSPAPPRSANRPSGNRPPRTNGNATIDGRSTNASKNAQAASRHQQTQHALSTQRRQQSASRAQPNEASFGDVSPMTGGRWNTTKSSSVPPSKPSLLATVDINNTASVVVIDDMSSVDGADFDEGHGDFEEVCSKKEKRARRDAQAAADIVAEKKLAADAVRAAKKSERSKALQAKRQENKHRQQAAKAKQKEEEADAKPSIADTIASLEEWHPSEILASNESIGSPAKPTITVFTATKTTEPLLDAEQTKTLSDLVTHKKSSSSTVATPDHSVFSLDRPTSPGATFDFTFDAQLASQKTGDDVSMIETDKKAVSASLLLDSCENVESPVHAPIGTRPVGDSCKASPKARQPSGVSMSTTTAEDSLSARLQSVKGFWENSDMASGDMPVVSSTTTSASMFSAHIDASTPQMPPQHNHPLVATVRPQLQQQAPPAQPLALGKPPFDIDAPAFSMPASQPQSPPMSAVPVGMHNNMFAPPPPQYAQQHAMSVWSNSYQTPMYGPSQTNNAFMTAARPVAPPPTAPFMSAQPLCQEATPPPMHHLMNQPPPSMPGINLSQPPPPMPIFGAIGSQRQAPPVASYPQPPPMQQMQLGSILGMPPPSASASYNGMPSMAMPPPPVPIQRPRTVTRTPLVISAPVDTSSDTSASKSSAPPTSVDVLAEIDRLIHSQSQKTAAAHAAKKEQQA